MRLRQSLRKSARPSCRSGLVAGRSTSGCDRPARRLCEPHRRGLVAQRVQAIRIAAGSCANRTSRRNGSGAWRHDARRLSTPDGHPLGSPIPRRGRRRHLAVRPPSTDAGACVGCGVFGCGSRVCNPRLRTAARNRFGGSGLESQREAESDQACQSDLHRPSGCHRSGLRCPPIRVASGDFSMR